MPTSVTAVTKQIKPDVYPRVDDEATIVVTYPEAQGVIQASWNWPVSRKDMEVYGRTGYVHTPDGRTVRLRTSGDQPERVVTPPHFAPTHLRFYLSDLVERLTGIRPFEFRNYRLV